MMDYIKLLEDFSKTVGKNNSESMKETTIFDTWMNLLNSSYNESIAFKKIHYNKAKDYFDEYNEFFDRPGIYVLGAGDIPRYIGQTGDSSNKTLKDRLCKRYISCSNKDSTRPRQFEIAELIREDKKLLLEDIASLKIILEDRGLTIESNVRLEGALDFANYNEEDTWFACIPIEKKKANLIKEYESRFILEANSFNKIHEYPPLLNKKK